MRHEVNAITGEINAPEQHKEKPMSDKGYNGWTNYETWLVALWIDNDQGSQEHWQEESRRMWEEAEPDRIFSKSDRAKLDLSRLLQEEIDESNPLTDAGLFTDLLTGAIQEVNWYEIASNWIDEVDREVATQVPQ